jgi:putative FmdB family regulatory protein
LATPETIMPRYDFTCEDCGQFQAWAPMSEAEKGSLCPCCNGNGARELSVPYISTMNGKLRRALGQSERSADEPRLVKRKHLDSCGCSLCRKTPASSSRRWMIGH